MLQFKSWVMVITLGVAVGIATADDQGANPGYLSSPYTNRDSTSVVRTAYGNCIHNGYYQPAYGKESCGDAQHKEVIEQVTFSESGTSLFNFNSFSLSAAGQAELKALITQAQANGSIEQITINGYTDILGALSYNQQLSQLRADKVKDFLISIGIESDTIVANGMGPEQALVSEACVKKYASPALLNQAALITANYTSAAPAELATINAKMAKFAQIHQTLVNCTAADRRVEITIDQMKQVSRGE